MQDFDLNPNQPNRPVYPERNGMETASVILGILAFLSGLFFYISIPLAALGIILALLSKGRKERTSGRAKAGIIVCVTSLIVSVVMTATVLYTTISTGEFQELLEDYYEYYYEYYYGDYEEDGDDNTEEPDKIEKLLEEIL